MGAYNRIDIDMGVWYCENENGIEITNMNPNQMTVKIPWENLLESIKKYINIPCISLLAELADAYEDDYCSFGKQEGKRPDEIARAIISLIRNSNL